LNRRCCQNNFMNPNQYPARVTRSVAMSILAVSDHETFNKIVAVHPRLVHRIPGEVRAKYLTRELFALLEPAPGVRTLGKEIRT
jgi:hypothetical protein